MAEPVVIALKITADAQTGGIKVTTGDLENMRTAAARAGGEWDRLGNTLQKKFSGADIGKSVLGGLGLGSGFAVAQRAADLITGFYADAAAHAKTIADYSERALAATEKAMRLRRTDQQELADLQKKQAKEYEEMEALKAPKFQKVTERVLVQAPGNVLSPNGAIIGYQQAVYADRVVPRAVPQSEEDQKKIGALDASTKDRANEITELQRRIQAAEVERLTSVAAATAAMNGATSKQDKDYANIAESEAAGAAALAQWNAERVEAAKTFRELADPQNKYQRQLEEIDALMQSTNADGKAFLSAQEGAAAKARVLAEMNDLAGKAIRASRAEVEEYDVALSILDKNPALSDQEKQRERIRLIDEQTAAIERAKKALQDFMAANPGVDVGALTEALSRFGDQTARNAGARLPAQTLAQRDAIGVRDLSDPAKHYQSAGAGFAGGLAQDTAALGTFGDQIAAAHLSAAASVRGSWAATFADIMRTGGQFKDITLSLLGGVVNGFINAGTQMAADWLYQHTVMAAIKSVFKTKDVATTAAAESAKTAITATGEASRTGIIAGASATNTAIVATEAGTIATATGIAGVFRSIMELGPIAGPVVFAASIAGMIALVSSLAGFAEGGVVRGPGTSTSDSILARLSNGEGVLNARAMSLLGEDFVHAANAGASDLLGLDGRMAGILPAAADAPRSSGGGTDIAAAGSVLRPNFAFFMDQAALARYVQENQEAQVYDLIGKWMRKNG